MKWKASATSQMSAPEPTSANVPATWLPPPTRPTAPTSCCTQDPGNELPGIIDTLSSVSVPSTVLLWLVAARPTNAADAIGIVSMPTSDHAAPSGELYAKKSEPLRTSRTQYGAATAGPDVCVLSPPVATRRWNATPFPDVTATSACRDPGVSVSRIMTPALAHGSVLCTPVTRATICPSPVSGTHTYWKASAVAQMSVPDARSVNVPFAIVALPGTPTLPTSWLVHAFGSVVVVVVA